MALFLMLVSLALVRSYLVFILTPCNQQQSTNMNQTTTQIFSPIHKNNYQYVCVCVCVFVHNYDFSP